LRAGNACENEHLDDNEPLHDNYSHTTLHQSLLLGEGQTVDRSQPCRSWLHDQRQRQERLSRRYHLLHGKSDVGQIIGHTGSLPGAAEFFDAVL
jgi:hypothetical protein